jgi:hypothetical protein
MVASSMAFTCDTRRVRLYDTSKREDGNVRCSAAKVDHHRRRRGVDGEACAECCRHRPFNQVGTMLARGDRRCARRNASNNTGHSNPSMVFARLMNGATSPHRQGNLRPHRRATVESSRSAPLTRASLLDHVFPRAGSFPTASRRFDTRSAISKQCGEQRLRLGRTRLHRARTNEVV